MKEAERQLRSALRTASFNNAAAADLIRTFAAMVRDKGAAGRLQEMAGQLDIDADTLEVFVSEINEGRISRTP